MLLRVLAVLPLILAIPESIVRWSSEAMTELDVHVEGADELLGRCLKSGLQLRYRFKVRLCKRRPIWFDSCLPERIEEHLLSYDPISGNYKMETRTPGSQEQRQALNFESLEEAVAALSAVSGLSLTELSRRDSRFASSRRAYIRARVGSKCMGADNEALAKLSYLFTFGLVRLSGFDTGWLNFKLDREAAQ